MEHFLNRQNIRNMRNINVKLPEKFSNMLLNLPESGMGYQVVNVLLSDGKVLYLHKVLNAEILMLEEYEHIQANDIAEIELVNNQGL